ncbi:hypothetical protein EDB87DRAFT_1793396 [Lactarius vividus]|nr:hypothetical protein EDB87DRAFT_1793396 [Lactarius vividus]
MYLEMATEEDKKMAENWKADADGILIFTGLFSAAVASLISVTIQDIRPNPQDTSNFYLANIYQTVSNPNPSNVSSSLPNSPPTFSPPNYAVWVHSFWFLSLVISLTCALLATLLQQWARRYLRVTQPRYGPHKRARIRAFFAEGVERYFLPWVVETLPTLLHVSLFLFFSGLVVFLCNVNLTIYKLVLSWVGVCTVLYGCSTFMPIFCDDSPYYTPLTSLIWSIVIGVPYVICGVLRSSSVYVHGRASHHFRGLEERYRKLLVQGMQKTAEETALNSPSGIDTRAFLWTFDSSDEDHELERFFSGLPGFRNSKVVGDPLLSLTEDQKEKFSTALIGLLDRTFSSDLLPKSVKHRRAIICAKALDPAEIIGPDLDVLGRIVRNHMDGGGDDDTIFPVQVMVTGIVATVQRRNDSWFILASNELGIPESVLRNISHSDLSFSILIHIARQQFGHYWKWTPPDGGLWKVLVEAASKFDVRDTSPELQHDFCALWNRIVLYAQSRNHMYIAFQLLKWIRNIYITLHQDTGSSPTRFSPSADDEDFVLRLPSSYPLCNVANHRPDPTPHIHDDSSTAASCNLVLVPAPPTCPEAHSLSVPLLVVESLADEPPLDNFYPAHQTTIESPRTPIVSPDPSAASAIHDIENSGETMHLTTPGTSASAPPLSHTSPPAALQHKSDLLTPSESPDLPSSFSNPVLDNVLFIGPPMPSHLPMARSDFSPSCSESRCSLEVTTLPSAPPGSTSAPDLDVAAKEDGPPKRGSRNENDALEPPSVNCVLDLPSPSPSLPSVTDSDVVAIVAPSPWESNAERSGDPPHPSHLLYDIV